MRALTMGCLLLLLGLTMTCSGSGNVPISGLDVSWVTLGWFFILGGLFYSSGGSSESKR